jgi:DNA uptake protein ComE-like DNA-binding protein
MLKRTYKNYVQHQAQPLDSVKLKAFLEMVKLNDSLSLNQQPLKLRAFNPNTDSYDSLIAKGIPPQLASNMISYREKVAPFKNKEELKKLYKMTEIEYERLKEYVQLKQATVRSTDNAKTVLPLIEVNKVMEYEFSSLKGIGSVLSRRIVAYRNLLGGFTHIEQLKEVYGISDSLYFSFEEQLSCKHREIKKINVNRADYKSLLRHPYINQDQVKSLLRYRQDVQELVELNELYKIEHFDTASVKRILPYLQLRE